MYKPPLNEGDRNLAVRAMQVGIARALKSYGLPTLNKQNGTWGKNTTLDVLAFKRKHKLVSPPKNTINPHVWGGAAWDKIEPFLTGVEKAWLATYQKQVAERLKASTPEAKERSRREAIVAAAYKAYNNRAHYWYRQYRPMAHDLFSVAAYSRTDCSSFVTLCYKAGGAPDPNGRGYDNYGFTGTLWPRGTKVYTPRIGDLVFYGWSRSGYPTHVALYVGNGEVISFGSTPIRKLPIRYRGDYMGCRTYPII